MSSIRTIEKDGEIYAKIFSSDIETENGMKFVTEDEDPLQVGVFERESGYEVVPHRHVSRNLSLSDVGEFLLIQKGEVTVTVFDEDWGEIESVTVGTGGCIVFLRGGHGLTMNKNARILEVKQGPYPGRDAEKVFRDPK